MADFVRLLLLSDLHQGIGRHLLLRWSAKRIGSKFDLKPRMVYAHWERIQKRLGVRGLGGLAQSAFTAALERLAAAMARAGGPPLAAILEEICVEGVPAMDLVRRKPREDVRSFRLDDFVHKLGLPAGRQMQTARRCLRDMSVKTIARDLGIRPRTVRAYVERMIGNLKAPRGSGNAGRHRLVLDLAEASFVAVMTHLKVKLRSSGWCEPIPAFFDLVEVLHRETTEDPGPARISAGDS